MVTRTAAIKRFLESVAHPDLSAMYTPDMEVQINVAQDGGERVSGDFRGRLWTGWTDGLTTWKPFRIPWSANSNPEYVDSDMNYDLAAHAEAIGMTGWDWKNRVSRWVAFDFDSILNHAKGLTSDELNSIKNAAAAIDWVTIRKSTSGKGLHLYIFLNNIDSQNHNEHAAIARAILGKLSALTGYDFVTKVDNCGGNMWVWARKMKGTDGLTLIKQGIPMPDDEIPSNWKDHVKVIEGRRKKNLPQTIEDQEKEDLFEALTSQRQKTKLDDGHHKLINWLRDNSKMWYFDNDHNMLVTHTFTLREAHDALGLVGTYNTISPHTNIGEQNCFMFPLRKGGWSVRRFSMGVQEHESWFQDSAGWTTCYFNREPDLATACRTYGGIEDPSGGFSFQEAEIATKAAALLGVVLTYPPHMSRRKVKLKQHKDGRLIIEIDHEDRDNINEMKGWLPKKDKLVRIFNARLENFNEPENSNYDDLIRHLITEQKKDNGWAINVDGDWIIEPLQHIQKAMFSTGMNNKDVLETVGSAVFKPWKLVNKPFEPEYPGDRQWNRNAAQLRYKPASDIENLRYPTWISLLKHCGSGLDEAIKTNPWCQANGILTGGDYLKCVIASIFQKPAEPTPYLFFFGPENSGKTIFHEALSILITKGYMKADVALQDQRGFNAELEGAIIAVIEEVNLSLKTPALNRIKDWVTSREILIHPKCGIPYHSKNTLHFIQCANDYNHCPVMPGDTRITVCYVGPLNPLEIIPKHLLIEALEKEASDFLAEILNLEIPPSNDRLNVPVIQTHYKQNIQNINASALQNFIDEYCKHEDGHKIKISDFWDRFSEWCDSGELALWSKKRVTKEMPPDVLRGRGNDAQWYYANIAWKEDIEQIGGKYILAGNKSETLVLTDAKRKN